MAKAWGVRPSALLHGSAGDFALDSAVWNVGCEIESLLNAAKDEGARKAILNRLERDAMAPARSEALRKRRGRRAGRS